MSQKAEQKERSHAAIIASAAALRASGHPGQLGGRRMRGAGLTVGGFYGHFESKEELFADTIRSEASALWDRILASTRGETPRARALNVFKQYLSRTHRDNPDKGCLLPSAAGEIAREGEPYRGAIAAELAGFVRSLTTLLRDRGEEDGEAGSEPRDEALALFALMFGALASRVVPARRSVMTFCGPLGSWGNGWWRKGSAKIILKAPTMSGPAPVPRQRTRARHRPGAGRVLVQRRPPCRQSNPYPQPEVSDARLARAKRLGHRPESLEPSAARLRGGFALGDVQRDPESGVELLWPRDRQGKPAAARWLDAQRATPAASAPSLASPKPATMTFEQFQKIMASRFGVTDIQIGTIEEQNLRLKPPQGKELTTERWRPWQWGP
jgi:TetR/AcrR family transcriptional repressor of nem operon